MAQLPTFFDMVNVNVTGSPGTGNMTLGSALIGFQAATGIANNTWVAYRATDGTNWESAHGQITISGGVATLASRGTDTLVSSNSNALVNFGAGVTVIICPTSQDINAFVSAQAAQSFSTTQKNNAMANIANPQQHSTSQGGFTTTSNSYIAAGCNCTITPGRTGKLVVLAVAGFRTSNSANNVNLGLFRGTGTAPAQGAAQTGTLIGSAFVTTSLVNVGAFAFAIDTGSIGTTYWYDIGVENTDGTSTVSCVNPQVVAFEIV